MAPAKAALSAACCSAARERKAAIDNKGSQSDKDRKRQRREHRHAAAPVFANADRFSRPSEFLEPK